MRGGVPLEDNGSETTADYLQLMSSIESQLDS